MADFQGIPVTEMELPPGVQMLLMVPGENGTVNVLALMEDGRVMETNIPIVQLQDFVMDGNYLNAEMLDSEV